MTHYRSKPVSNPATNSRRPPPTPVPLIVNSHSGAGGAHTPGSVQGACKPASAPARHCQRRGVWEPHRNRNAARLW